MSGLQPREGNSGHGKFLLRFLIFLLHQRVLSDFRLNAQLLLLLNDLVSEDPIVVFLWVFRVDDVESGVVVRVILDFRTRVLHRTPNIMKNSYQSSHEQVHVEIENLIAALFGMEDEETSHIKVEDIRILASSL